MDDKELLQAAARAAGIEHDLFWSEIHDTFFYTEKYDSVTEYDKQAEWNPLTDPGDALRLAVQLNMDITMCTDKVFAAALRQELVVVSEPLGTDPLAATMRAITRAAAEIGRAKT